VSPPLPRRHRRTEASKRGRPWVGLSSASLLRLA
jgi:hypothetical protein